MTYEELISWQYENALADEWHVAVNSHPSADVKTLLEIKALKESSTRLQIHVMHSVHRNYPKAEWTEFETESDLLAKQTPRTPLWHSRYNKFNATADQMVALAQQAIVSHGYTVTAASKELISFETGMTWGSWSGALCSISMQQHEPFWFTVRGSGKQNVRGAQLAAFDFGETDKIVNRVIQTMQSLAK